MGTWTWLAEIPWTLLLIVELVVIFGYVLIERRQPSATLAWLLTIISLPVIGVVLYLVFGRTRMRRQASRRRKLRDKSVAALGRHRYREEPLAEAEVDERTEPTVRLAVRMDAIPASRGNDVRVLVNAAEAYAAMRESIDAAAQHLHLEFYIWNDDGTGRDFRDRLVAKARAGVEVRVLVDAFGSSGLPNDFFAPLLAAGGHAAQFSPLSRFRRLFKGGRVDFRNHRKLLIADGNVGFTGGINIGDEYLGKDKTVGMWRDTHMRIEGPAVYGLQRAFLEDWCWASDEAKFEVDEYFPKLRSAAGNDVVLIVDSGPDRRWWPIYRLHVQAIALARNRIWLTNPYFLPDRVMEEALVTAALRGVDVRVLVPVKGDSRLVALASEALFPTLIDAGIKIYRYGNGFVHAKTLLIDDWLGTVGSANLDTRSFQLNFELNAFAFGAELTGTLAKHFESDVGGTQELKVADVRNVGYGTRLARQAAHLLSPLL
ncbi:MAG: cardiolipin synthase [Myxococcales bacterium]|nr:cardiolipin synthase [Myxococcales bacterium]